MRLNILADFYAYTACLLFALTNLITCILCTGLILHTCVRYGKRHVLEQDTCNSRDLFAEPMDQFKRGKKYKNDMYFYTF